MQLPDTTQADRLGEMIAKRKLTVDDDAVLRSDLICRKCRYNLKTQSLHTACPECGEAVADSILYPAEASTAKRLIVKAVDLFAFLTIWYFCTIACLMIISGVIMLVDSFIPFAAVMRERYPTTALTILLLLPTFFLARTIATRLSGN